jgi:hypothetical protein
MRPGRALDEKVARLIWPDFEDDKTPIWITRHGYFGPEYSSDPLAALGALEELARRGWGWRTAHGLVGWYYCELYQADLETYDGRGATLPLAVCAAILVALKGE